MYNVVEKKREKNWKKKVIIDYSHHFYDSLLIRIFLYVSPPSLFIFTRFFFLLLFLSLFWNTSFSF